MEKIEMGVLMFYLLSGMIVLSSIMILFSKNIVRSVFMLIVVFLGIAGIFMISNAEYVGVTQILIYIGGILVLMMFGIMLTTRVDGTLLHTGHKRVIVGALVGLSVFVVMMKSLFQAGDVFFQHPTTTDTVTTTETIGINLMTNQILALELIAFLLLVALVGAAFISGGRKESVKQENR